MIIRDEGIKARILELIGDDYSRRIIMATIERAKSAAEISRETELPLSSTYRKIHDLQDAGLIAVERILLTPDGKKQELYRSTVRELAIRLQPHALELSLIPNEDVVDKFARMISYMREAAKPRQRPE
jgi:predicted transcriptional regulator